MPNTQDFFGSFRSTYEKRREEEISLADYLDRCRDPTVYVSVHGRLLSAIGEPEIFDTSTDERLGRIFQNRTIRRYPAFKSFFGIETAIEDIVSFLRSAKKGAQEASQICYLLGPPGGGKSSIVEEMKKIFERVPFYALADEQGVVSPIFESPLGLFYSDEMRVVLENDFKVDPRFVPVLSSRWAQKRLDAYGGDVTRFKVKKLFPSIVDEIGIAKAEPGEPNTQDLSVLVGKTDIRRLDLFAQSDPDSYSYSGAMCRASTGILDFVEMFKADIKLLNPFLTALQEHNFKGTESVGAMPYYGLTIAHSNEEEWQAFRGNKRNEAFIDRISLIRVPYCVRKSEEVKIYEKMIAHSELRGESLAPGTLELMAKMAVLSRINSFEGSPLSVKMRVYDGENLKDKDIDAKSTREYREKAGVEEAMKGLSTRFAFKVLSRTFQADPRSSGANPVRLLNVLEDSIRKERFAEDIESKLIEFLKNPLEKDLIEFIEKEIRDAYFSTQGGAFAQNKFEQYYHYADHWVRNEDYVHPETQQRYARKQLDTELEKIEKPASISNPKDFRNDVVNFILRAMTKSSGKMIPRTQFQKLNEVIEKSVFPKTEDLIPIISFGKKGDADIEKKHDAFLEAMKAKGYSVSDVQLLVEWWSRKKKSD